MIQASPSADWPFGSLMPMKYGAILVDPPWHYELYSAAGAAKSPQAHYDTMTIGDIARLPVGQLAGPDCLLFLWSTWPHLQQALNVMSSWGFTYKTGGAWVKRQRHHWQPTMGTGYVLRSATEPFLIGTIGRPGIRDRAVRNVLIDAQRREHSRKPPEARQMIERLLPHAWCCELFAREPWPGHDVWGNQTERFAP